MASATQFPKSPFRHDVLAGRVVIITGGGTGIGFGCATTFGKHGAKVAIMSRRKKVVDEAVQKLTDMGIDAFGTTCDVRNAENCVTATDVVARHFGRIDFLINNAAGNFMVNAENLSPNGLATVLGIDLQGTFHMSKAVLPHMKKTGATDGACIVNMSAFLQDHATPFQLHAASAKAGIDVVTNTLGVEWAEYGIRTVGVAPGGIAETVGGPGGRVFGSSIEGRGDGGDADALRRQGIPAGRWGTVEDIALAALFLCSPAATWITATRLTVDGGSMHGASGASSYLDIKRAIERKSALEKSNFKGGVAKAKL